MKRSKKQQQFEIKIRKMKENMDYVPQLEPDEEYSR
jgi:hypothetical protein